MFKKQFFLLIYWIIFFNFIFSYVQPPPPPPQGYPQYGGTYPDDNYGGNRNRASGYNPSYQQSGPVTTTQVTIPTEMAGKKFDFSFIDM